MLLPALLPLCPTLPADAVELQLEAGHSIELEAEWGPLTDTVYRFEKREERLANPTVAERLRAWDSADFRAFLPEDEVEVGEVWTLEPEAALPFLRQLHPGVTHEMHHGRHGGRPVGGIAAEGSAACLVAASEATADVLIRVHADIRLDETDPTAWFTPAQFEGRLVIDRANGSVRSFELAVPDGSANVDVNLVSGVGIMADIGRVAPMSVGGGEGPDADVDLEAAREALARHFYPVERLDWFDLPEALEVAREEDRPLHVIVMFGSLTDESC